MLYESKRKVSAVKFDGTNINLVRQIQGLSILTGKVLQLVEEHVKANGYEVRIDDHTLKHLKAGDYIVNENGSIQVMSAKYFEQMFKPLSTHTLQDDCEEYVIDRLCAYVEEFGNDMTEKELQEFKDKVLNEIELTLADMKRFKK